MTTTPDLDLFRADQERHALTLATQAQALTITDAASAQVAADLLNQIGDRERRITGWFKDLIDAAYKTHKTLTQRRAETLALYARPKALLTQGLAAWNRVERDRREAARREAERIAAEKAKALQADLIRQAKLEKRPAEAKALAKAPPPLVVPDAPPEVPKVDGVTFTETWGWQIVDPAAIPCAYHSVDAARIDRVVKVMGPSAAIPGIKIFAVTGVRRRG